MSEATTDEIPQELLERNLQLPTAARRKLAEILLASSEADLDLKAKLTKRWEDYQSGKTQAISFEESQARLGALLGERKK